MSPLRSLHQGESQPEPMMSIPERTRHVSEMYRNGKSLEDIACDYGLSREGVRQIFLKHPDHASIRAEGRAAHAAGRAEVKAARRSIWAIPKQCAGCGKTFAPGPRHTKASWTRQKYCSAGCGARHIARARKQVLPEDSRQCLTCGGTYHRRRNEPRRAFAKRKFCSYPCVRRPKKDPEPGPDLTTASELPMVHSAISRYYHVRPDCLFWRRIKPKHLRDGRGGGRLCGTCRRLLTDD